MFRTRIKIDGIMSADDAAAAAEAGADAIGMILYAPAAKRTIDADLARRIAMSVRPFVSIVGVVVDCPSNRMRQLTAHIPLAAMQLHGRESVQDARSVQPISTIKKIAATPNLPAEAEAWARAIIPNLAALLIESPAPGGSGTQTDWPLVESLVESLDRANLPPIILAGGLRPETVHDVVRRLRPWAVDVSSGVEETLGQKSPRLMAEFVQAVREADDKVTR